ncbi:MAG: phosphatidate cytidylyltransferase [Nanoarchaeota archaeon]
MGFAKVLEKYCPEVAIAYGSGVFSQKGYGEDEKPMVDFIFGVDEPKLWHKRNLRLNRKDYSIIMGFFGPYALGSINQLSPGTYYNPYIDFGSRDIKYGAISMDSLIDDLTNWTSFYIAGRLQKPTRILKSTPEFDSAQKRNLENALNTALFMLPENFTRRDLFLRIAGLSYLNDSRMGVAENPRKIQNIVDANIEGFERLYEQAIRENSRIQINGENIEQDTNPETLRTLYLALPKSIIETPQDLTLEQYKQVISRNIGNIVNLSSKQQTIKALVSAGILKSAKYLFAKLQKAKKN